MVTYTQLEWSDDPNGLVSTHFDAVYPSFGGRLIIGVPVAGFSVVFFTAAAVLGYLPTAGAPAPLDTDAIDPPATASGAFGGNVVALTLAIDYSDDLLLPGSANLRFGDLLLCATGIPGLDGQNL
jgi:hypothetical protein